MSREAPSELKSIPVVAEPSRPRSGEKYVTAQGFTAIRDGLKARRLSGQLHAGEWLDVGSPARLAALDAKIRAARR